MTIKEYRAIWHKLIDEKFKEECYQAIAVKLKRIRFIRNGEPKPSDLTLYAKRHFPHLIELYRIRIQAEIVPKRKMRTRESHHSPKHDQMSLIRANQLTLFK